MDELDLGATLKGFSPGQKVFARYTLKKILGRGGMGVVWLARDEELEREVALKFLPEVVAMDKQSLNELKRETRRSLELTHPHIIRIYDFVQDGRTAAISMEYVAGDTLAALKADRPGHCFEAADLTKWVGQLCDALAHAHGRAAVVHRDLKPANLMVDARGDLKVADFGIAASVSDSVSRVSNQSGSSGTPVYMSPQQMMGEKPAVTDDLYSVGATLFDLLTGKPPFHSGNIIAQVQAKVPPSVAERRADLGVTGAEVPPAWEATIAACLAKEPKDRPQSAAALLAGLRNAERGTRNAGPSSASPQPEAARVVPNARVVTTASDPTAAKKSMLPFVAAVSVVALVLAGAAWWWFGVHQPEQARLTEEARIAAEQKREAETRREQARQAEAARQAEIARLAALRIPVTLRTEPSGAEVFVAGQSRGLAPVVGLPLPLGEHSIVARMADHDDLEYTLSVAEKGQTEWTLPLKRSVGRFNIEAEPEGARYEIWALGARRDDTPARQLAEQNFLRAQDLLSKGLLSEADWAVAKRDYEASRARGASPVLAGRLPAEGLSLPTGSYELVVISPLGVSGPEHSQVIAVRKGETVDFRADVRTAALQINTAPAGATVLVDGREVGRTPFLLERQLPGTRRQVELRLDGYEAESRAFELTNRDAPETWSATLREVPKLVLRPSFADGPREFELTIEINSKTSGQTVASGQVTPIPETRNTQVIDSRYSVGAYDTGGLIRRVSVSSHNTRGQAALFRPGTVVDFDFAAGSWVGGFRSGGFAQEGNSLEFLSPSYPATWIDSRILPEGPATVGRTWDIPASAATILLPSLRFQDPSGTIRGRVIGADVAAGWAEVEYAFDLRGPLLLSPLWTSNLAAGQSMSMTGAYAGTIVMRFDLTRNYVSRAQVKHRGTIETRVSSGGGGGGGSSLFGAVTRAAVAAGGTVLAQTNMNIDTDVIFTARPALGPPPVVEQSAAPAATVPVIFYRKNNALVGVAARILLLVDGKELGSIRDGEYLRTELPVGPIRVQGVISAMGLRSNTPELEVILKEGDDRYFEFAMTMGGNGLQSRSDEDGAAAVRRLKPAARKDSSSGFPADHSTEFASAPAEPKSHRT